MHIYIYIYMYKIDFIYQKGTYNRLSYGYIT